jgi:beta-phosphoglucomutase
MIKMTQAVCFDLDGIITDTETLHFKSWQIAFEKQGIRLNRSLYNKTLQSRAHPIGVRNIINDASDHLVQSISNDKRSAYEGLIEKDIKVYSDTLELIRTLNKYGIKMVVVSSSTYAKRVIERVGLSHYFEFVVSGTKGLNLNNKPAPDTYLYAMNRLGVQPSECFVIEDSVSGMTAGLKSGASVIGVMRHPININQHRALHLCDVISTDEHILIIGKD